MQTVGKPNWNSAQPYARVQDYLNDDLRADGLRKGWGFRVGTWNVAICDCHGSFI